MSERLNLIHFIRFFAKLYPNQACPNLVSSILCLLHQEQYNRSLLSPLLKNIWLSSNKSLTSAWLAYQPYIITQTSFSAKGLFSSEYLAAVHSLNHNGFYIFKNTLPLNILSDISSLLNNVPLIPELPFQKIPDNHSISRVDAFSSTFSRYFYSKSLMDHPLVLSIAHDPSLLAIIYTYLRSKTITFRSRGWLSVGRPNLNHNELSSNAQLFHIDLDAFRFLKVFIYLSDVNSSCGPHAYVSGSNHPYQNPTALIKCLSPSLRINEADISLLYGEHSIKQHVGKAGTIIIEDTSGFHRGTPLQPGAHRDLLSFVYESGKFSLFY